jgi:hypothetical protein
MKFLKGMYKDSELIDQPAGTHRDALNINVNINKGSISNEYGNTPLISTQYIQGQIPKIINQNRMINGSVLLPDNKFLVFYSQRYLNTTEQKSASFIYLFDPEGDIMTLLYATSSDPESEFYVLETGDLNFSPEYPITGESAIAANGDTIVYFTDNRVDIKLDPDTDIEYFDNYNPPRVFNINRQLANLKNGAEVTELYVQPVGKSAYAKHVDYLNLFPSTSRIPEVASHSLVKGGALETAAYYLCLGYATEEYTETNIYTVTQPVYIPKGNYDSARGGIVPTVPFEHMTGAPAGTQTDKGISWYVPKYDYNYPYIVPYIIKLSGTTRTAYKLSLVPTAGQSGVNVVFTGTENYATASVEDIVLDKATYLSAKVITQLDNKMYLGNLTARKDVGYQRFANNIKLTPVVKTIKRFDARVIDTNNLNYGYTEILKKDHTGSTPFVEFEDYGFIRDYYSRYQLSSIYDGDIDFWIDEDTPYKSNYYYSLGGYRNQTNASYLKSFRRGEVYAIYISLVLKDGTETYAYHVPGRIADTVILKNMAEDVNEEFSESGLYANTDNNGVEGGWLLASVGPNEEDNSIYNPDLYARVGDYRLFNVHNTGIETFSSDQRVDGTNSAMGYWQNNNEIYPNTPDFKVYNVLNDGTSEEIDSNTAMPIRHHKFPSNLNDDFSFIEKDRINLYRINIPSVGSVPGYVEQSLLLNLRTVTDGWNDMFNQSGFFYENIRILGFKLENIKFPRFILKQIQGFKVYYAKRTLENKTILGQSILHNQGLHRAYGFFSTSRSAAIYKAQGPLYKYWSLYSNVLDLTYGGNRNNLIQYNSKYFGKYVVESGSSTPSGNFNYLGSPIVTFNDFTMLRKKINLNIVDYTSIQMIVTMHQYQGGFRGMSKRPGESDTEGSVTNTYPAGYHFFREGMNEGEDFTWISASMGNTDTKYSVRNLTTGKFEGWSPAKGVNDIKANVLIGAVYNSFRYGEFTQYENSKGDFTSPVSVNPLANIFTVTNNGATYINALNYLKVTETDAFHSAQYIDNYAGPTTIVLALRSGLPHLQGLLTNLDTDVPQFDTVVTQGTSLKAVDPNKVLDEGEVISRGKPNVYLANLNSYKTDVFNPFDTQQLVWTGYYHPCQISTGSIATGDIGGSIECTQFNNYPIETFATTEGVITGVQTEGATAVYNITSLGDEDQIFILPSIIPSNEGPVEGQTYEINLTFDPELPDDFLTVNFGTEASETIGGDTSFSFTLENGSTLLSFSASGVTTYTGQMTLSISLGTCVNLYDPEYLSNAFVNTDNFMDILTNEYSIYNNYYRGLETGWIFGGDTFICRHSYRLTSSDFPNYYLVQNLVINPSDPSSSTAISDYSGIPIFNTQISLPELLNVTGPTPLTVPSNLSTTNLDSVAYMNQRVLRTYPNAELPYISSSSFNLLSHFVTPYKSADDADSYALYNFEDKKLTDMYTTLYSVFVESDDNLNFRHAGDVVKGVSKSKSLFFDSYNAAEIVFRSPLIDLNSQDNLLYEDHYSALQDIKVTIPFPKKGEIENVFPSRVIRSNVQDGRIDDNYRSYLALQYKDFSQNKGAITNLVALNGLLFIHTEKSLYKTTGKQNLQLGDSTEAYIGSGDLFAQEPLELITATEGYGGSYNKFGSLISRYGYVFVSRKEKKIFLLADQLYEISQSGMENWFRLNIPFTLETINSNNSYPINLDDVYYLNLDAPTGSFGFVSTYDPVFKRLIITKRELIHSNILQSLMEYFDSSVINSNIDNAYCLNSYSELTTNIYPYNASINVTNNLEKLILSYVAPVTTDPVIWYDPNLGGYIFTTAISDILIENGYTTWQENVVELSLTSNNGECTPNTYYLIQITKDNYWWKENGWTVSYYLDGKVWSSRHSYVSPWYMHNSEQFFSFDSYYNSGNNVSSFIIWKHNNASNPTLYYGKQYNYEFEFVVNDSPDITKLLSSINFIADTFTKNELNEIQYIDNVSFVNNKITSYDIGYPFNKYYIYNNHQNSGVVEFKYLQNLRRVEGSWSFNDFRDLVKYNKNFTLSDNEYNISGGFNNNVLTPYFTNMFLQEGVINPEILDTTKPWYEKKKFSDKFIAVRLIGENLTNLVNLYSVNASFRKSSR